MSVEVVTPEEEDLRQRVLREKEEEEEQFAREKELEDENARLDKEIEQEIRGLNVPFLIAIFIKAILLRVDRGGKSEHIYRSGVS